MQTPREIIADRYELLEVIGQGGQALVFRARDREKDRDVAVKIVNKSVSNDAEWVERMAREQQAMVALAGTSAVGFIDLCSSSTGALCLVMELLEGTDLEGFLSAKEKGKERLSVDQVVQLMTPIVDTLEKAHSVGIVHRDLKPANIFIPSSGEGARLLDFGFSRSKTSRNVTAAGTIVGSPSYIAPEMWLSKPEKVDQRADIYAVGVILFRMLGGELPFKGDTLQQKFITVTTAERPSLHALRRELPEDVDIWVERVLAIDPKDRFATVRASFGELSWALGLAPHPREQKTSEPASSNEVRRIREWLEAPFSGLPNTFNAALKFAKGALQRLKRLAFATPALPVAEAEEAALQEREMPRLPAFAPAGDDISEVLAWAGDASGTRPTLVLEESEREAEMATFLAHAPTVSQESEPPAPPAAAEVRAPPALPPKPDLPKPLALPPKPEVPAPLAAELRPPPTTRVEPRLVPVTPLPVTRRPSLAEFALESTVLESGAPPAPSNDVERPPLDETAAETARPAQVLVRHGSKAIVPKKRPATKTPAIKDTATKAPATKDTATTRRSVDMQLADTILASKQLPAPKKAAKKRATPKGAAKRTTAPKKAGKQAASKRRSAAARKKKPTSEVSKAVARSGNRQRQSAKKAPAKKAAKKAPAKRPRSAAKPPH